MKKILIVLIISSLLIIYLANISVNTKIPHYKKHLGSVNHIVAHRGFSSLEYENSYESIKLANESDCADAIEIDVRLTSDGYLVLSHDNKLIISRKNKVKISKITYNHFMDMKLIKPIPDEIYTNSFYNSHEDMEIKNYIGNTISLKEALKIVKNKLIIIDIKYNNNIKQLNDILLPIVKNKKNVILQSNKIEALKYLKKNNSKLKCQYLISKPEDFFNISNDLYGVSIRYDLLNNNRVNGLIKNKIKVFTWTINDTKIYEQIINEVKENSNKIYYITDYPDILCNYNIWKLKEI